MSFVRNLRKNIFIMFYLFLMSTAIERIAAEEDTIVSVPPFVCIDGSKIPLANVCDGISNCPDSSDELRKLCHHIV